MFLTGSVDYLRIIFSPGALDLSVILVANKTDLVRNRVVRTPGIPVV
jgi:hypothetical protein